MADTSTNGTHEKLITISEALRTYAQLLNRVTMTRAGITFSGKRDLYETLGYRRDLRYEDYYERYLRGGIAARAIDAFPAATWRLPPVIREIGKDDETMASPFEAAWDALATRLRVWHQVARVDRLASIGHYAVLLLGLRGQTVWDTEAQRVRGPEDVLYLNAYSEDHATILRLVNDDTSPLFGRPHIYNIDFSRRLSNTMMFDATLRPSLGNQYGALVAVHASRVLHIAEHGIEDDIIGTPRLRAVWNYFDDLEKVAGGTAEMVWQDAKRRIILNLNSDATLNDPDALTAEVEEFTHELRNFLRVQGMEVTQLEGKIPDPSGNIDKLLDVIAGTIGMPKRKLVGSERGELASDQDEHNWATTIRERQQHHAEPLMLRALIDKLIALNALPVPRGGYTVEWPNLLAISEKERSEVALNWARTIATYAGTMTAAQDILPLEIFLEDILEFPKEQVARIMELLVEGLVPESEINTEGALSHA